MSQTATASPESVGRGPGLRAPLRWLGRKLSGLVRRLARHVPAPVRWLGRLFAPGRERGFGFWWLVATLGVAVALGMVVALLLTPAAGLIALLVVAIWALVRRRRHKRAGSMGTSTPMPPA
jgi:apolipoprotein N-acyltransferase